MTLNDDTLRYLSVNVNRSLRVVLNVVLLPFTFLC